MSKHILLFREHQNFQVGKTRLKKGAVFETNIFGIGLALILGLLGIWVGGYSLRMSWQYLQSGATTKGTLLDCRIQTSSKSTTTYVRYEFFVDGQRYEAEDSVENMRCSDVVAGTPELVYYLADNPEVSRLEAFVTGGEWMGTLCVGSFGIGALISCFALMLDNRKERLKHARLQTTDTIVEGKVFNVGMVKGKNGYHYAHYRFATPKGNYITGQIRSNRGYKWPKDIQEGDTLDVLYFDDESYCVL